MKYALVHPVMLPEVFHAFGTNIFVYLPVVIKCKHQLFPVPFHKNDPDSGF